MCGRFATAFLLPEKLKSYFQLDYIHPFIDSFNIAPSLPIPAIRTIDQQRILAPLIWGLIPHWARERETKSPPLQCPHGDIEPEALFPGIVPQ